MKRIELEIICIYRSDEGREVTYFELINELDIMDAGDYTAENFWNTMGGLKITIERYKTIFYSTNFYNIFKPVNFLLHSLYKIKNINSDWFDTIEDNPNVIIVQLMNNDYLELKVDRVNKKILLSVLSQTNEYNNKRGNNYYFFNEIIDVNLWVEQTEVALTEYFEVFSKVLLDRSDSNTVNIMKDYLMAFQKISEK